MVKHVFDKNTINQYIRQRLTKNFIDILILLELTSAPLGGYDIINIFNRKFSLSISPGTVYSTLYSLERMGLIKGGGQRKRIYTLTRKGEEFVETVLSMRKNIELLMSKIFETKTKNLMNRAIQ
ncbi:MAG: PadR family transcriptional regulator [Candidatus Bathyarchaeia archaeon]